MVSTIKSTSFVPSVFNYADCFNGIFSYLTPSQSAPLARINHVFNAHLNNKLFCYQLGLGWINLETSQEAYKRALSLASRMGLSIDNPFLNLEKVIYGKGPLCLTTPTLKNQSIDLRTQIKTNIILQKILTNFSSETSVLSREIEQLLVTTIPNSQTLKYASLLTTLTIFEKILLSAPQSSSNLSALLTEVIHSLFISLGQPMISSDRLHEKMKIIELLIKQGATSSQEDIYRLANVYCHFKKEQVFLVQCIHLLNSSISAEQQLDLSALTLRDPTGYSLKFPINPIIKSDESNKTSKLRHLLFCESAVHTSEDLVIGEQEITGRGRFLIAYNKHSYESQWGIALKKGAVCKTTEVGIVLVDSTGICDLINPQTGQIIHLKGLDLGKKDDIHITKSGIGYCTKDNILYGLQYDKTISKTFQMAVSPGHFTPFGDYILFECLFKPYCINARGEKCTLPPFSSLEVANKNIYMIYQPLTTGDSLLTVFPENDLFSITDYSKYPRIKLPNNPMFIHSVCDDGTVICYGEEKLSYYFIHIDNQTITRIPDTFGWLSTVYVDKVSKAMYSWNSHKQMIFQHTEISTREVGITNLGDRGGFRFVYLDNDVINYVYFPGS